MNEIFTGTFPMDAISDEFWRSPHMRTVRLGFLYGLYRQVINQGGIRGVIPKGMQRLANLRGWSDPEAPPTNTQDTQKVKLVQAKLFEAD